MVKQKHLNKPVAEVCWWPNLNFILGNKLETNLNLILGNKLGTNLNLILGNKLGTNLNLILSNKLGMLIPQYSMRE